MLAMTKLAGVHEVAEYLAISKPALAARRRTVDPAFPAPLVTLRCGPIWDLDDVVRYDLERRRRFRIDP